MFLKEWELHTAIKNKTGKKYSLYIEHYNKITSSQTGHISHTFVKFKKRPVSVTHISMLMAHSTYWNKAVCL